MDYKIKSTHEVTQTHEFSVDWNGFNFLIIYGHHINGWFIAIPNWNKCTEAREPEDVAYNATKLVQTHIHDIAPMYLARAIKEHWEGIKEREEKMRMLRCKTFWIYLLLVIAICAEMVSLGYTSISWQYWFALGCVVGAFQCGRFDERNGGK